MPNVVTPVVVDIFSGDKVEDFAAMYASGIRGVIHKASQGVRYKDGLFATRRTEAEAAGLMYGAYHFGDSNDVESQVDNFLAACGDLDGLLLALDYEDNPRGPSTTMRLDQARQFLELLMQKTGRSADQLWIYGGNRLQEEITNPDDVAFFGQFKLWFCRYNNIPGPVPKPWKSYCLWQCSADGHGPLPHKIAGSSTNGIDINVYNGPDLAVDWAPAARMDAKPIVGAGIVPPHPVKVAAMSPTTWLVTMMGVMISHLAGFLSGVGDFFLGLFSDLPKIASDTQGLLSPAMDILRILHAQSHEIEFVLGLIFLAIVIVRNTDLHLKSQS